jgi:hypothetical protein
MLAALIVPKFLKENRIFKANARDNALNRFKLLREELKEKGISLATEDIHPLGKAQLHIHHDINQTSLRESNKSNAAKILIVSESPIICPENHYGELRKSFDRILSWESNNHEKDTYWLGCGCSFTQEITQPHIYDRTRSEELCMIAGNKRSKDPNELYSTRDKAIEHFSNSTVDFSLFGVGWDQRQFQNIFRPLNRVRKARTIWHRPPKDFKGAISSKYEILRNFHFSLAFENAKTDNGYITEKLFDSMFSGCIPIYIGASDITDFVPENTFINANAYYKNGMSSLERMIQSIDETELQMMRGAILNFTHEFKKTTYFDATWAKSVAEHCIQTIHQTRQASTSQ